MACKMRSLKQLEFWNRGKAITGMKNGQVGGGTDTKQALSWGFIKQWTELTLPTDISQSPSEALYMVYHRMSLKKIPYEGIV